MDVKLVLDGLPYMVWTYDEHGAIDYFNSAALAYTGVSLRRTVAFDALTLGMSPRDASAFTQSQTDAMSDGIALRTETPLRHRSGEYRRHAIRVDPIVSSSGRIDGWIGTAIDVEEAKLREDAYLARENEYQQELARSTIFQRAVLPPHLPKVAGLTFDAVYEAGLSDEQVGGDWYDAVRLLDGRVLVTIGDVSGHGLNAAVIMGVVRQIMRGIAQLHAEPTVMLDAVDRAMRIEYPDVLVTAWVGVFDLVESTLNYASAGHPPPLMLKKGGGVEELDHLTLPIGLRQGHQGHASQIEIPEGAQFWLYTDGLIEADHDIIDGMRRLHEAAQRLSSIETIHPASTIRHSVIPDGSPDDVAILVVKADATASESFLRRSHFDSRDADAAHAARRAFVASLSTTMFSENDIANAQVVFGELCGNVARYAPGRVDVVVDSSGVQTVLHVLDRGAGFRYISGLPRNLLDEFGRGLFIVTAMTTEFTVTQRHGGGSHTRAVLVGRHPVSLLRDEALPAVTDQAATTF
jgi:PAS domain S-box-containing protein